MKPSRGSSLYEVLKNASRTPGGPEEGAAPAGEAPVAEAPATTLQERLAAYKAQKLAEAQQPSEAPAAVAVATPPPPPPPAAPAVVPSAPTMVLKPEPPSVAAPAALDLPRVAPKAEPPAPPAMKFLDPLPTPVPAPAPAGLEKGGPGERVLKITYNTAAFAALVVVGLVFVAYAMGIRSGKSAVEASAQAPRPPAASVEVAAPKPAPPPPPAPVPVPKREFTVRLTEWKYGTPQERLKANAAADDLKRGLEKAGHKGVEKAVVKRGAELRLALYAGTFTDLNSEAARAKLATLRAFKAQGTTPFSQAVFEEAPQ